MGKVTVDDVTRMVQALVNLHDKTGRILDGYGHDPSPGSQAADELNEFDNPEFIRVAYAQANMLMEGVTLPQFSGQGVKQVKAVDDRAAHRPAG
jgi:hypothetical protein